MSPEQWCLRCRGSSLSTAVIRVPQPRTAVINPGRDFGVGSFLMTSLAAAGFCDAGPRFSLRRASIPQTLLKASLDALDAPMMGPVVRRVRLLLAHHDKQLRLTSADHDIGQRELSVLQRLRWRQRVPSRRRVQAGEERRKKNDIRSRRM